MGWLNFGGKKGKQGQGFGKSQQRKSRKPRRTFVLEKIVTPSAGVGDWLPDLDSLHQLASSLSLPDLHLPNLLADGGVCPIDPSAPTNNLPPLIDFDPLGLYDNGTATQPSENIGGAFETLPVGVIPVDPQSPTPNNPNAIRQLLDFPLASQPLVGTIDTGVSANSPYFDYAKIEQGRDYVDGDNNPLLKPGEGSEHGTFMLGIVDAINKKAPKWVGRAIDSGRWADSLVEFVDAAKASGQKNAIANLSLDLTQKNADGIVTTRYELTPAERSAIEYARQNGVLLVVAAGNDGGVMSVLGQASQEFDNIVTVGSADGNNRAVYSSFGRGLDIVAEGGTPDNPELSTVGDGVGTMAGTSVATAKVAGAASLVWAANPDLSYRQVIEILEKTAKDLGVPGRDDETGFGFLNALAAVDLAKKTTPEIYNPTPWVTPDTWSGEGKVTPEERAAKGGNSIATATVQVSTNFSDIDRVDANQPNKYYQFTMNEPGYITWNLTSLNPVLGFPTPPRVNIIKADGKPASHTFSKGVSLSGSVIVEEQTSFSDGKFYEPGTYYLKVGNGAFASFNDYSISTQFTADRVSSFAGSVQYRTQPLKSFDSSQSALFSGPTVSELKNLSGQVAYNNTDVSNRIAKYGFEVNESGKFQINLKSPNGKIEGRINKFIGSEDTRVPISGLGFSANSDEWLELDLNKGRYEIEVKTPSDVWQEPDWNSTQQTLVRPYTLNATFTPNAPQPGQGKVPASAGAFDKTVVSNGVVNHYYANGYLTVQPSGQASWYGYGIGVTKFTVVPIPDELPQDYAGNLPNAARNIGTLTGTQTFHDVIDKNDRFDYYKFNLTTNSKVDFALSGKMGNTGFYLFQNWKLNSDGKSTHIDTISGTPPGVVPEFSHTLTAGTYYVLVHKPEGYDGDEYHLKLSATPLVDPDGDYSMRTAGNLFSGTGGADFGDGVDRNQAPEYIQIRNSIGGQDLSDFYKASFSSVNLLNFKFSDLDNGAKLELIHDRNGNGQLDSGEVIRTVSTRNSQASLYEILPAGNYYLRVSPASSDSITKYVVDGQAKSLHNQVVAGHNSDYYYLVQNDKLRMIPNRETLNALKIDTNTVKRFSKEDLDRIPYGDDLPSQKDGDVFSDRSGNIYLMQSGKRHWVPDGDILKAMGISVNAIPRFPLSDLKAIELGAPIYEKNIDAEYEIYKGLLGTPTNAGYWQAADSKYGTKGYGRNYEKGSIYWTAKYGAIAVPSEFANIYHNSENKGSNGELGFPIEGKEDWKGGQRIKFENGYIYWTEKEGARAFKNGELPWEKSIAAEYAEHQELLGNPTTGYWQAADSPNGTKGHGQNYEKGSIYWTAKSGAIAVPSEFANIYHNREINDGSRGWLGFPTKRQETWKDWQRIEFEGGYIYWNAQYGAKAYPLNESPSLDKTVGYDGTNVHPTYVNTFNRNGGSSALGSPIGNVHPSGGGYLQTFLGGSEGSGAIMKSNANNDSYWVGDDFWAEYQNAISQSKNLGYPTSDRYEFNGGWKQDFQGGYISRMTSAGSGSNNGGNNNSPINGMTPYEFGHLGNLDDTLYEIADRELGNGNRWIEIRKPDGSAYTDAEARLIQRGTTVYLPNGSGNNNNTGGGTGNTGGGNNNDPFQPIDTGSVVIVDLIPINDSGNNNPVFPYISIESAYDETDGDNFIMPGSQIRLSGKTNSQNVQFYLGDIPLTQGKRNFDGDNFSATLIVPPGVSPGSYQIKAIVNTPTGDATSSGLFITVDTPNLDNGSVSFQKFISKVKDIESDINKWSWKTAFPSAINEQGYVTANILRRKSREKYRGLAWEASSGWNGVNIWTAWGESLPEFSSSNGKGEQTVSLGKNITIPVGHFFASLAYQFGNLGPWTQNTHASYGGDIGSVLQAAGIPNWDVNVQPPLNDLDNVIKQKFPDEQKDADIAAHVIASIVKSTGSTISSAIESFKNMTQKEKYQKFVEIEFGSLAQAKNKLRETVRAYLSDRDSIILLQDGWSKLKLRFSEEEINQALDYVAQDFIDYIKQKIG